MELQIECHSGVKLQKQPNAFKSSRPRWKRGDLRKSSSSALITSPMDMIRTAKGASVRQSVSDRHVALDTSTKHKTTTRYQFFRTLGRSHRTVYSLMSEKKDKNEI